MKQRLTPVAVGVCLALLVAAAAVAVAAARPLVKADVAVQVAEELPLGTRVARLTELLRNVTDLRVRLLRPVLRDASFLRLDDDWLVLTQRLDRETLCPSVPATTVDADCQLSTFVNLLNATNDTLAIVRLRLEVLDVDDNLPVWNLTESLSVPLSLYEHSPLGADFFVARTIDVDTVATRQLLYTVEDTHAAFGVKHVRNSLQQQVTDVYLTLQRDLDREVLERFDVRICVREAQPARGARAADSRCATVNVALLDLNDNAPVIVKQNASVALQEDQPLNRVFYTVEATDRDVGVNADLTYRFSLITRAAQTALFAVDQQGRLSLRAPLDFETAKTHKLFIDVFDKSQFPSTSTATVQVSVIDTIDEFPVVEFLNWPIVALDLSANRQTPLASRYIQFNNVNLMLVENNAVRTPIADVRVSDADADDAGRVQCVLSEDSVRSNLLFDFSPLIPGQYEEYTLVLNSSIDRERTPEVQLRISCLDSGWPQRTTVTIVNIRVLDVNDNAPAFSKQHYYATVDEGTLPNQFSFSVTAHDADSGENGTVRYRIAEVNARQPQNSTRQNDTLFGSTISVNNAPFVINNQTGTIYLSSQLDREVFDAWRLRVIAADGGSPPRADSAYITLYVGDTNDNRPAFQFSGYHFRVAENVMVGTLVGLVRATDSDAYQNQEVEHFILQMAVESTTETQFLSVTSHNLTPQRFPFGVDERSGWLRVTAPIDREQVSAYRFVVVARDRGALPLSSSVTVVCDILDENDNAPVFTSPVDPRSTVNITKPVTIGVPFLVVRAIDPDADANGRVTYAIRYVSEVPLRAGEQRESEADQSSMLRSQRVVESSESNRRGERRAIELARQMIDDERFSLFTIDLLNGELVVRREIRASDNWKHYEIVVEASDQAEAARVNSVILHVDIRIDEQVLSRGYQVQAADGGESRNRMLLETSSSIFDNANFIVVFTVCCIAVFVVLLVALAFVKLFCKPQCAERGGANRSNSKRSTGSRRSTEDSARSASAKSKAATLSQHSQLLTEDEVKRHATAECERLIAINRRNELLNSVQRCARIPNVDSEDRQSTVEFDEELSVKVCEEEPCVLKSSTFEENRPRLRSFNPDRRVRTRNQPLSLACDSLSEYFQLRRSTADSVAFRDTASNNVRQSRCTLCKSNTIGEFGLLQRSFNDPPLRAEKSSPRSCDASPRASRTHTHSPSARAYRSEQSTQKHLLLSSSYCDEYRPVHPSRIGPHDSFTVVQVHSASTAAAVANKSSSLSLQEDTVPVPPSSTSNQLAQTQTSASATQLNPETSV